MKIGLIGLGIMGKPMAKNLLKAGYKELYVWARSKAPVDELVSCGAIASSKAEIGSVCDVVLTMLPNSPQVKEVLLGEGGVAETMHEGQVFIDMSSINPIASKEISEELAKKGVKMLDAPVSGGIAGAAAGTMTMMCSGDRALFDEVMPVLQSISGN